MEDRVRATAEEETGKQLSPEDGHGSGAAAEEPAGAKKSGLRRVEYLILGLVVLLVMVLVGGGGFIWLRYTSSEKTGVHTPAIPQVAVVELEPFFVPLKSQDEPEKFLLVTPALEVADKTAVRTITGKIEQVRATMLQIFLGSLPTELDYPQGNKELITTLISSLNRCLKEDVVTGISFKHAAVL